MAEVRLRLGRGAYNFARKTNRYLIANQNIQGKSAIHASSLSAGFLVGDSQNGELYGDEKTAERVTNAVSQDMDTRVTPLFGSVDDVLENAAEHYNYFGLNKEYPLKKKSQVQNIETNIETNLPRYRINFGRTSCTFRSACPQQSPGLCCKHGQFVFIRAYSGNGARFEPLYKTKTGYYEILEVSPTATQAQIKTAYYKQSFVYHPDRNASSEEATVRFSEISEAYTVLGNKALRKKYDRGLLSQSDLIATARPSSKDTGGSAKQPTESRRSVVGADIRGGVTDFDKFIKAHYNEQLQKQRDLNARKEEMLRKKQETIGEKTGQVMELGVVVLIVLAVGIVVSSKRG